MITCARHDDLDLQPPSSKNLNFFINFILFIENHFLFKSIILYILVYEDMRIALIKFITYSYIILTTSTIIYIL